MGNWQKELPPREKLLNFGVDILSDAELLALFLRTGTTGQHVLTMAQNLIDAFGSIYHILSAAEADLLAQKGVGKAKYAQLKAVCELSKRYCSSYLMNNDALTNPNITRSFLHNILAHRSQEIFLVLFLDNKNRVILHKELFTGTINRVEVYPREIVREALKLNAAALIIAHNHPSGEVVPSKADRLLTQEVIKTCELLELRVLDHFIIGHEKSLSFAEQGWM